MNFVDVMLQSRLFSSNQPGMGVGLASSVMILLYYNYDRYPDVEYVYLLL